ncbi:ABC transporter ATP-binding protein [Sulfoacidibacillus thermotolerans]|uniref:ABC transporter domain-containing protein n=1 Tax=Sulfoacidibacillus thermotolerans TaxID=1765684 RepID=A0A2U3DA42_SULT2|nr:ABC transporter ATP-binding protein [Sulfoacidibacillus thermotolerans]PWI58154.1 hypothetical protein BM613_04240 [Sulfoacidibacillus thermotolerans]
MLEVKDLWVKYRSQHGRSVSAVRGVNFSIPDGTFMGLVGESGCGKSTLGFAIARLLNSQQLEISGSVLLNGEDLIKMSSRELRKLRWDKIAIVLQGGMNAFNPVLKIKQQFTDVMKAHGQGRAEDRDQRIAELLRHVQLDPALLEAYPHELSGGMKQRVAIALSLVLNPELVILDEPTTALDVIVQKAIVEMLQELQRHMKFSVLFISHDLGLVLEAAERVMVMYAGKIVEEEPVEVLLEGAKHPYTEALLSCYGDPQAKELRFKGIPGSPPDLSKPLQGCSFVPRCSKAMSACRELEPQRLELERGAVACHLYTKMQGGIGK